MNKRLEQLTYMMTAQQVEAVAVNPGPTLSYLTGLSFHLMERPTLLLLAPPNRAVLVLAELEKGKVASGEYDVFTYDDNPATWPGVFRQAAASIDLDGKRVGVEPARMRFLELRLLEQAAPHSKFVSAEAVFADLRMRKEPAEIMAMRKAVKIAQSALLHTLALVKPGASEREIASELSMQLLHAGSDPELPFPPIVASGPNSANPHASPSERRLAPGDMLVIDWGAAYNGYFSDLTRTFAVGKVDDELLQIASATAQANAAARAAARPGLPAGAVDLAARQVIADAGYAQAFTHRTGHGLGLEAHEPPYIFAQNSLILQPGMTFTIEPGIYLPGYGGVRVEDDVVITENGAESLSDLQRDLLILE